MARMQITPESLSAVKTTLKLGAPTGGLQALTGLTATQDSTKYFDDKSRQMYKRATDFYNDNINFYRSLGHSPESAFQAFSRSGEMKKWEQMMNQETPFSDARDRQANKGKPGYNENGYPLPQAQPQIAPKTTPAPASKPKTTQTTMKSVGKKLTGK